MSIYETLFHGQLLVFFLTGAVLCGLTGGLVLVKGWTERGAALVALSLLFAIGGWLYVRWVGGE